MSFSNYIFNKALYKYKKDILAIELRPLELYYKELIFLVKRGSNTKFGLEHNFDRITDYESFTKSVPIREYEDFVDYIDLAREGKGDILWPGKTTFFAKSSGTTNDKSKYIPITREYLENCHYYGGKLAVASYFNNRPKGTGFKYRTLILGGSKAIDKHKGSVSGDLSAILISNESKLLRVLGKRTPSAEVTLTADFDAKVESIYRYSLKHRISSFAGVPSWNYILMKRILEFSGKSNIHEIWPDISLFLHGGVCFKPYREQYLEIFPKGIDFIDIYNASEGYFGFQSDLSHEEMLLVLGNGVFYEFGVFEKGEVTTVIPLDDVKIGVSYALIISNSAGLWRYLIGDLIKFTSLSPFKFVIAGRTKMQLNVFGEEVSISNVETALIEACKETGAVVVEFTVAPIFMSSAKERGGHQWAVEFDKEPLDLNQFASILDLKIRDLNSDYDAKRKNDFTLLELKLENIKKGVFDEWMRNRGRFGGQNKVPRLSSTRDYLNEILSINATF